MKKQYQKPEMEVIHFNYVDIITASGECIDPDHHDNGNHYGWCDPQPEHGNDGEHGHNHH